MDDQFLKSYYASVFGDAPSTSTDEPVSPKPAGTNVERFVNQYLPAAERAAEQLGVTPDLVLGQWGLETGWGRSIIPGTNNLGNIKDTTGQGVYATDNMTGSRDAYRKYGSVDEFADGFVQFLGNKRYQQALNAGDNPALYFGGLKRGGYAEDADYVAKGTKAALMARQALGGVVKQRETKLAQDRSLAEESRKPYIGDVPRERYVPEASFSDKLKDTAIAAGSGVLGGVKSLTDLFGADNSVSETLDESIKSMNRGVSFERQAEMEDRQKKIQQANQYGSTLDQLSAYGGAFLDAPVDMFIQSVGTMAPSVLAAALMPGGQGAATSAFVNAARYIGLGAIGAGQGAGFAKGSIYEQVQDDLIKNGYDQDTAKKVAAGAQAYDGENGGLIAANAVLGAIASGTGLAPSVMKFVGRKAATEVVETAAKEAAETGVMRNILGGVAKESPLEAAQGGLEAYTGNVAKIGVGKQEGISAMANADPMEGVAGQAFLEGLAASPGGAIGGIMDSSRAAPKDPLADVRKKADEGGILSKAAVASNPINEFGQLADELDAGRAGQPQPGQQDAPPSRFDAIRSTARETIESLRKLNPTNASEFLEALAVAQDPRTPENIRNMALDDLEKFTQYAKEGSIPGAKSILSDERGVILQEKQDGPAATQAQDVPAIETPRRLYGPNVIDGDVRVTDSVEPAGNTRSGPPPSGGAPTGGSGPGPSIAPDAGISKVSLPRVDIPAGDDTAQIRQKRAQLDALAKQGFETVEDAEDGPRMVNSKTGQFFPLADSTDVALAKAAIKRRIDEAANQAATSPQNDRAEPTEAQKLAGNYKKGEPFDLNGFRIVVENPSGSVRRGKDPDGKEWESPILHHYGDLKGVKGVDGDDMDVFIGRDPSNQKVFVIDQIDPKTGKFDEHKVMMGFASVDEAADGYLANYESGWQGMGSITEMTLDEFRQWTQGDGIGKEAAKSGLGTSLPGRKNRDRSAFESEMIARLAEAEADRGVTVTAAPPGRETNAVNMLLDAFEKLTGYRGIAVKATGPGAWDGVYNPDIAKDTFFVNVDQPMMAINATIAHEFKHLTERFPSLKKLYDRLWDMIPDDGRRAYYNDYLIAQTGRSYEEMTQDDAQRLKDEMLADFMGKRFADASWMRQLAKQKPKVFGDFVRDWARILQAVIDEIRVLLGSGSRATEIKDVDRYLKAYEGRLQQALDVALDVASEWAASNPKMAASTGVDQVLSEKQARTSTDGNVTKSTAAVDNPLETSTQDANETVSTGGTSGDLDSSGGGSEGGDGRPNDLLPRPDRARLAGAGDAAAGPGLEQDDNGLVGANAGALRPRYSIKDDTPGVYGTSQDGSRRVVGVHFSSVPRPVIDSSFYGSGLKGLERDRLSDPKNKDIRSRIYFYVNTGNGIRPESGVGGIKHTVQLNNVYDVLSDPKGIVASTRGLGLSQEDRASAWERAVMAAGYDGYVVLDPSQSQGYAVLVGRHSVTPRLDVSEPPAIAPNKATPKTRKEGSELVRKPAPGEELLSVIRASKDVQSVAPTFRMSMGEVRVDQREADVANAVLKSNGSSFQFSLRDYVEVSKSIPKGFIDNLLEDNYARLKGVDVDVSIPTESGGVAKLTVDAGRMLMQIEKRQKALEMVRSCLL